MKALFKKIWRENPKVKKTVGVILVIVGFIGIVTPFTPWGLLFFLGLEILGVRFLIWDKIKSLFKK